MHICNAAENKTFGKLFLIMFEYKKAKAARFIKTSLLNLNKIRFLFFFVFFFLLLLFSACSQFHTNLSYYKNNTNNSISMTAFRRNYDTLTLSRNINVGDDCVGDKILH